MTNTADIIKEIDKCFDRCFTMKSSFLSESVLVTIIYCLHQRLLTLKSEILKINDINEIHKKLKPLEVIESIDKVIQALR